VEQAAALLGTEATSIGAAITILTETGELIAATTEGPESTQRLLALAPFARAESGIASRLQALHAAAGRTPLGQTFTDVDWEVAFRWLAERHAIRLAPEQEAGVWFPPSLCGLERVMDFAPRH
jgi:hypothetical protein